VRIEKPGFVFRNFNLLPRTTALQNVILPLDYALRRPSSREARRWALVLLDRVGLADRVDYKRSQMSGGQQQRVAIGRALVNRPWLVLADEPTGNLDSHTSDEVLRILQQLNGEGITVILVTHDPHVAAYARPAIRIHDGQIESDEAQTARAKPALQPAAGPRRRRWPQSLPHWPSPPRSAWPSASIPPGRRPASIRSKHCATSRVARKATRQC
jgi:macrolide transport system ATP-binding/permease protein